MSNLLPTSAQKEALRFYRANIIIVGSLLFLAGAFVAFLSLLPAYVLIRAERMSLEEISERTASGITEDDFESERMEIARAQVLVTRFSSIATSSPALAMLQEALEVRPRGVSVQDIRYTAREGRKEGSIVISGTVVDRTSINAYREALVGNSNFESVSVPVGALAGSEVGQFSITLTGAF